MSNSDKKKPLPIINKPARKKTKKVVVHISETALLNIQKQIAFIQKYDTVLSGSIKTVEDFIAFHVEHLSKYFSKAKFNLDGSISEITKLNAAEVLEEQESSILEALDFVDKVNRDNPKLQKNLEVNPKLNSPSLPQPSKPIDIHLSDMPGNYIDIPLSDKESEFACFSENDEAQVDFWSKVEDGIESWTVTNEDIQNGFIEIKDEEPEETFNKKNETYDEDEGFDE